MNERRSLHPLYIAYGVLNVIKGFIPVILIMLLRGVNWEAVLRWYWIAGAAGLLALLLGISYLQWKRFGFWLEQDRIVIRSGLLFRGEKTIYYSRIHSVNVEQPLIQRLLGIAQLKIETPGGGDKSDGILHALSVSEASVIREQLKAFAEGATRKKEAAADGFEESTEEAAIAAGDGTGERTSDETLRPIVTVDGRARGTVATGLANDAQSSMASGSPAVDARMSAGTDSLAGDRPPGSPVHSAADKTRKAHTAGRTTARAAEAGSITLGAGQLFKAAATSLNFGLALAFIGGLYSFADDFLELLLPDQFFRHLIEDSRSLMPSVLFIVFIAVFVIGLTWALSIGLFILKFSGFTMRRDGQQVSISYGLLEKKSYVFDPKNVQAVIINESLLRQLFGFAEVRLQIVSSDKQEQLMLHPFVKFKDIDLLLARFVPGMRVFDPAELAASPRRAWLYYIRIPYIIVVALCAASIGFFGVAGLWSLFLLPLTYAWCLGCHRAEGVLLKEGQLTLRKRFIGRTTYCLRKARIVAMKVKSTKAQRSKELTSLSVHVLGSGSAYDADCLERKDVEAVWRWYSRHAPPLAE
jgi:putative membrane protein